MKFLKLFTSILALLIAKFSLSQEFSKNYIGENYPFYKSSLLRVDIESNHDVYFYNSIESCKKKSSDIMDVKEVYYPILSKVSRNYYYKYDFKTSKDSLLNKVFLISNTDDGIFTLIDTINKDTVYFTYKSYDFPFLTTDPNVTEDLVCPEIQRESDDFTGSINIRSPLTKSVFIQKTIEKSKSTYYLFLEANGSTLNVGTSGVIILFKDGTKISKDVKVEVDYSGGSYVYSSFIILTPSDLSILSNKEIDKYRLYIYDQNMSVLDGGLLSKKIKLYTKCIINMK